MMMMMDEEYLAPTPSSTSCVRRKRETYFLLDCILFESIAAMRYAIDNVWHK
jgi:hypothetical protein